MSTISTESIVGLPIGPLDTAVYNNLHGFNHQPGKTPVPIARDRWGYVFFTRPQLNLQTDNIQSDRRMSHLLTKNPLTIQRAVRCLLDPRLAVGYKTRGKIEAPLIDNNFPFIAVMSNDLLTLSGWPDETLPLYTSKEGLYGEQFVMADGIKKIYKTWSMNLTFRNTVGKPVKLLIDTWTNYASNVFTGIMQPYTDNIILNEIDYLSRCYRVILDKSGRYVTEIAATGYCLPEAISNGGTFDYDYDAGPYNPNKELSVGFTCVGAIYNDPILVWAFNDVVRMFKPNMEDGLRENSMMEITAIPRAPVNDVMFSYNHRGYPRINPMTYRMEWWVDKQS